MSSHAPIPDDVAALISAHALGALEPDQAALAEEHIAASDACRRAYEDALETAAALALAVADSEPPAELRDRILAAARAERQRPLRQPVATPRSAPPAPARGAADAVDRLRGHRRGRRRRVRADRRLATQLGVECARPAGGARVDPVGARRAHRAAGVVRRRRARRPRDRRARPGRARQLAPTPAAGPHLPGLGPALPAGSRSPCRRSPHSGAVVILDDVGKYDGHRRDGRAERRLAAAVVRAVRRREAVGAPCTPPCCWSTTTARCASSCAPICRRRASACSSAAAGEEAVELARERRPSLVLLDVRLPGIDGFEVLRRFEAAGVDLPVIMLTSLSDEVDQLVGFRLGAVDYVTKPVSPKLLAAKVKAFVTRVARATRAHSGGTEVGPLVVEHDAHRVLVAGREVALTRREFDLLAALAEHPGWVYDRDHLHARRLGLLERRRRDARRRPARRQPAPQARGRRRATGCWRRCAVSATA